MAMSIRKNDQVIVRAGKDRGKKGRVLSVLPEKNRVIVEGALSGMHRASVHGYSVEFAEHKEYSPGDELRHVDWKAFAKLDRFWARWWQGRDGHFAVS